MITILVLIPILAFVTVVLLAYALVAPKQTTTQGRLRAYGYNLSRRTAGDLSQPFTERVIWPALARLARSIAKLTPSGVIARSQERLRQARSPMSLTTFLLLRVVFAVAFPAFIIGAPLMNGQEIGLRQWAMAAVLLLIGYRGPDMWLSFRIDARREQITRALPDALDLIVVCVEAGNGLEAAIAKVVETTSGPLAQEFGQALTEISLGRTRREALHDLAERGGSNDLQAFIAAILQADQMGVSIADTLRVQADAMRVRRRQHAEELIAKAPVKMLLPMTGFIFPALMIVLLGPAAMKIMAMFAGLPR